MTIVIRSADAALVQSFSSWATNPQQQGTRMFCVEGLPGSGKSFLIKRAAAIGHAIDLDDFLDPPVPSNESWPNRVMTGGAPHKLLEALGKVTPVLVGGAVAWPVIKLIAPDLEPKDVLHVYIKKMGSLGGNSFWHDGEYLNSDNSNRNSYSASIYDYHAKCKPWEIANLVIERIPSTAQC